ncbi:MAG TPA: TraR/DksA C4-type zinc finger protein [Acidimicrobiia bacterium]|nr:TraR/DksA C4-type zinc finger protein [Acidimicrobiia bacterium]
MSTFDTSKAKTLLIEERVRLVHQLDELGAAESGDLRSDLDFGDSFADAGSVTAERTEVLGLVDSIKGQLDDVDAALARIEAGKYGICANCGKEIAQARLEARPESILCIDCKTASR